MRNLKRSTLGDHGVFKHAEVGLGGRNRPLWTRHESTAGWPTLLEDVTRHNFSEKDHGGRVNYRRQLLRILIDAGPMGVHRETIFDELYSWDPEGGPDHGPNIIKVMTYRLNAILEKNGWYIASAKNGAMWLVRVRGEFIRHIVRRVPVFRAHVVQAI